MSLQVPAGQVLGLLGPNGAGKTTTVRILATLLRPDGGRAIVAGFDVVRQARQVRAHIGLVGQHAAVDEILSGRSNLVMFGRLYGLSAPAARRRADELLQQFQLDTAAARAAGKYSGGMRRRLDLAVSLIAAPRVLFLTPRCLHDAGIEVADLTLRRPTLDEVFLHLTGASSASSSRPPQEAIA